jgi:hypothetical protein
MICPSGSRIVRNLTSASAPPNKPLELTPLRVEQDRGDFEAWFPLTCFPDLEGGAAQRQAVIRIRVIS